MIVDYIPASVEPDVLICAIHAGVEHGSGDVARAIHAFCRGRAGLYVCYDKNHVTSARFHEPLFDTIVGRYKRVISIHGMDRYKTIALIGGRDKHLVHRLRTAMGAMEEPPRHLSGMHPLNVVNRGTSRGGVQVEVAWIHLDPESPLRDWIIHTISNTLLSC
jgi:phage replication-related protein YjqB (UPF0714/DUF867 family)